MAQRSHPGWGQKPSTRGPQWFLIGSLLMIPLVVGLVLVYRPVLGPQKMSSITSLGVKGSADGRVLGHFPYPEAKESQLVSIAPGMKLREEAADHFRAMQQAALADGVSLNLISAYRSIADQKELFFSVKAQRNQTSLDRAKVSAPPGFSEHSTGYAVDIGDSSQPQTNLSQTFAQTSAYRWLVNNAARFQFALSFPLGNAQRVSFEPWHWRYEGSVEALRLFEPAQRLQRASKP